MKKKVLCAFALILYVMAACTLLSGKIRTEMTLPVTAKRFPGMSAMGGLDVPETALFTDEAGTHLYQLVEGTGWESGLRIQEFTGEKPVGFHSVSVIAPLNSVFILSAPRLPQEGRLAEVVELEEHVPSRYLLVYPDWVPGYEMLPYNTTAVAQSENALLLQTEDGIRPFMEHKVKSQRTETYGIPGMAGLSDFAVDGWRVYCLEDVEQFLEALPAVTVVLLALALGVVFWAYSCRLSIHAEKNKAAIFLNIAIIVGLLCLGWHFLGGIDLPASLLPRENIFQWPHYTREFSQIFGALETLLYGTDDILTAKAQTFRLCGGILCAGVALCAAVLLAESRAIRRRNRRRRRRRPQFPG